MVLPGGGDEVFEGGVDGVLVGEVVVPLEEGLHKGWPEVFPIEKQGWEGLIFRGNCGRWGGCEGGVGKPSGKGLEAVMRPAGQAVLIGLMGWGLGREKGGHGPCAFKGIGQGLLELGSTIGVVLHNLIIQPEFINVATDEPINFLHCVWGELSELAQEFDEIGGLLHDIVGEGPGLVLGVDS